MCESPQQGKHCGTPLYLLPRLLKHCLFRERSLRHPQTVPHVQSLLSFSGNASHSHMLSFLLAFDARCYLAQLWCSSFLHVFPFDLFIVDHLIGVASGNFRVCIQLCFCMLQWPAVTWASNVLTQHRAAAVTIRKSNNHEYSLPHLLLTNLPFSCIF